MRLGCGFLLAGFTLGTLLATLILLSFRFHGISIYVLVK